jgi:hypothetical protein
MRKHSYKVLLQHARARGHRIVSMPRKGYFSKKKS